MPDRVRLTDGTKIEIRPISPEDRDALAAGMERLSVESRYRRFFAPVSKLSERQLDYLTQVDHHDHEALVAVDAASGDGIGVARFVRVTGETAEPAIVVVDDWQRRGVGRELLEALAERAREEGISQFVAPVLAENDGAIAAFERLGNSSRTMMGHEVELTVDLTEKARASSLLRELLRVAASGAVEPARSLWELLLRGLPAQRGFGQAIVVGIDPSQRPQFAVDCAGELAAAHGLPVHVVAAQRPLLDDRAAIEGDPTNAERRLAVKGVEAHVHLQRGDPALSILYVAVRARAGLIVLPSSAPDPQGARVVQSQMWDAVAHNAQCNVLIAREPVTDR
jgi:RimJ/RimL family protein N-acetyltransferase/nucleotide-binding universal stress UspA family protein